MKRNFFTILLLLMIFLILFTSSIWASTKSACILTSNHCGIISLINHPRIAATSAYESLGYTTNTLVDPSPLVSLSNLAAKTVQLYYCHGSSELLCFDKGGLHVNYTGTLSVKLPDELTFSEKDFYSINNVNLSNVKLITLAACNSAGNGVTENNSIAGVMASKGAQMVVGWKTDFSNISGPSWLDNYHAKLKEGLNPLVAVNYANGFSYIYDNVKNTSVFYNSLTPLSNDDVKNISNTISTKDTINILPTNLQGKINISNAEDIIYSQNSQFDISQYEKQTSDGIELININTGIIQKIESYIDYNLKVGDFITDSSYTVVIDENNNIKRINDETINSATFLTQTTSDDFIVSEETKNYFLNKSNTEISNEKDIINKEIKFYYNIKDNKKYAFVKITLNKNYVNPYIYYQYEM